LRRRIRAYNEAVGVANTGSSGYHETLTRFFLRGFAAHIAEHPSGSLPASLAALLQSPLGRSDYPLRYYSRECFFPLGRATSRARHQRVEPDL
jgi:hypothetical protein